MKSKLPVPTAKNINDAHQCARESAENAVEWAIRCGELLIAQQDQLGHGGFHSWIEGNCDFALSTAKRYITAAKKKATGVAVPSLSGIFPSGQPGAKSNTPKGAVSVVKPKGTEETSKDWPAASTTPPARASQPSGAEIRPEVRPAETVEEDADSPERPDIDDEEDAALARAEGRAKADRERRIDAILESKDQLAEAVKQLAQQSALIGVLETTRDGYMRGKEAVTKMLQAEERKVARLEKENKSLRDRLGDGIAVNGGRHERPAVRA